MLVRITMLPELCSVPGVKQSGIRDAEVTVVISFSLVN